MNPLEKDSSAWKEASLLFMGVIFYLFVFPHGIHGDGYVRYLALKELLQNGNWGPQIYSLVGPLISSPLILLGKIIKDEYWWLSRFNTLIFLGTSFYFYSAWKNYFSAKERILFLLLLFCASMFPKNTTDYYSEVLSACFIAIAFWQYSLGRFSTATILSAISVWNSPGTIVGAGLALTFFAVKERRLRLLAFMPLLPLGILAETYLKFGTIFPDAYLEASWPKNLLPYSGLPGFSYPLFFGVLSVIFSFGRGLLFFVPGLLFLFHPQTWKFPEPFGSLVKAGAIYSLGLLLVYARWWSWDGGWFWGPRFYLFTSFLAVLLFFLHSRRQDLSTPWRIYLWGAMALSFWVGCQGILFGMDFQEPCYVDRKDVGFMCYYVPEMSILWRPFVVWPEIRGRKVAYLVYFVLVAGFVLWQPGLQLLRQGWEKGKAFFFSLLKVKSWRW